MLDRTSQKAHSRHAAGLLFSLCLWLLSGFSISAAPQKESVTVAGKSFLIEIPNSLCEGSKTDWGMDYKKYLSELGSAAGGKPKIISVIADCDFVASAKEESLPSIWGYLAFDMNIGTYWFGQHLLNNRMKKEIQRHDNNNSSAIDPKKITNNSLKKLKSDLSIGEISLIGNPIESRDGFLVTGLARLESEAEIIDVYLTTVTFIRNRQIITFAIYKRAISKLDLDQVRSIGKQFLNFLSDA